MPGCSPFRPLFFFSLWFASFYLFSHGDSAEGAGPKESASWGLHHRSVHRAAGWNCLPRLGKGTSPGTPLRCRGHPTGCRAALNAAAEAAPGMLQAPAMVLRQAGAWEKSPRLTLCFPAAASSLPAGTLPQPGWCCRFVSLLVSGEVRAKAPGPAPVSASSASGCSCAPYTVLTSSPPLSAISLKAVRLRWGTCANEERRKQRGLHLFH